MNLLLDTHAFIWFVENDKRLPEKTKTEIEKETNSIIVSIASLWELTIKHSLGKLEINSPLKKIIQQVESNGFELLPIIPEHFIVLSKLAYYHNDPFDRLIIAQCVLGKITVASKDIAFDNYDVNRMWG